MAFPPSEQGAQYWCTNYIDDDSTRNYQNRLDHERIFANQEPCFTAFRLPLPISALGLNVSYNNDNRCFQGLAPPSLTPPFHIEHSLDGQYSPLEWAFDYEVMRTTRYMSPNGPHGGSFSESSASSESAYTPDVQSYPIRFSQSPANVPGQYSSKPFDCLPPNSTPWSSEPSNTFVDFNLPQHSSHTQHGPSLSPKELQFEPVEDLTDEHPFHEHITHVHQDSPMHRPEPEELDLTSINTESTTSTLSTPDDSESEQIDEAISDNDSMAIDDDHSEDSDYEVRPRRRTSSRNATGAAKGNSSLSRSPRYARRISSQNRSSVMDPKARVHKSGPSSNTSSSNSAHARKMSRSKPKTKKPEFVKRLELHAKQDAPAKIDRPFPCTFHHFGCTSEFPNKNEWKRHVAYQHLQLGYYRCDMDNCDPDNKPPLPSPDKRRTASARSSKGRLPKEEEALEIKVYNDFNRKDLFTQHCRRMHGPTRNPKLCSNPPNKRGTLSPTKEDSDKFEEMLQDIRERCWNVRRQAPARSSCGFCNRLFVAESYQNAHDDSDVRDDMGPEEKAWEARMEHIGKHYEKDRTAVKEMEDMDDDLKDWGIENGLLHELEDGRAWLVNADTTPNTSVRGLKASSGINTQDTRVRHPRKATRQPSKTVEYHVKAKSEKDESPSLKIEDVDSDDDAEGESDNAVD